jgi:hypothetical protein
LKGPDGDVDRAKWIAQLRGFAESGLTIEVLSAVEGEDGSVAYGNRLTIADGKTMDGYGVAEFEGGKCIRMTPKDAAEFKRLLSDFGR